jgi:hypothetical protein
MSDVAVWNLFALVVLVGPFPPPPRGSGGGCILLFITFWILVAGAAALSSPKAESIGGIKNARLRWLARTGRLLWVLIGTDDHVRDRSLALGAVLGVAVARSPAAAVSGESANTCLIASIIWDEREGEGERADHRRRSVAARPPPRRRRRPTARGSCCRRRRGDNVRSRWRSCRGIDLRRRGSARAPCRTGERRRALRRRLLWERLDAGRDRPSRREPVGVGPAASRLRREALPTRPDLRLHLQDLPPELCLRLRLELYELFLPGGVERGLGGGRAARRSDDLDHDSSADLVLATGDTMSWRERRAAHGGAG